MTGKRAIFQKNKRTEGGTSTDEETGLFQDGYAAEDISRVDSKFAITRRESKAMLLVQPGNSPQAQIIGEEESMQVNDTEEGEKYSVGEAGDGEEIKYSKEEERPRVQEQVEPMAVDVACEEEEAGSTAHMVAMECYENSSEEEELMAEEEGFMRAAGVDYMAPLRQDQNMAEDFLLLKFAHSYDLAQRLDTKGVWKEWLGDKDYISLQPHLVSPESWEKYLSLPSSIPQEQEIAAGESEPAKVQNSLTLQFRVRSLLFDRVVDRMYSPGSRKSDRVLENDLLLQPNGIYFTLDHDARDWRSLLSKGGKELSSLQQKYGLPRVSEGPRRQGSGSVPGDNKRRFNKASRELSALMPDVKPVKKNALQERQAAFVDSLGSILKALKDMGEVSEPFLQKVRKSDAPDYYEVIKEPMDLGTMMKKLRSFRYADKKQFQYDIDLIASNCREYNEEGSLYTRHVAELQARAHQLLGEIPDSEEGKPEGSADVATPVASQLAMPTPPAPTPPRSGLDASTADVAQAETAEKASARGPGGLPAGSRQGATSASDVAAREEFVEHTWYNRWLRLKAGHRMDRFAYRSAQKRLPFADRDAILRTPAGMGSFLEGHRRAAEDLREGREPDPTNKSLFPELHYPADFVPDVIFPGRQEEASGKLPDGGGGMSDLEAGAALRRVVVRVCRAVGFSRVQESCVAVLAGLLGDRLEGMAEGMRVLDDGDPERPFLDVVESAMASAVGIGLHELQEFLEGGAAPAPRDREAAAEFEGYMDEVHAAMAEEEAARAAEEAAAEALARAEDEAEAAALSFLQSQALARSQGAAMAAAGGEVQEEVERKVERQGEAVEVGPAAGIDQVPEGEEVAGGGTVENSAMEAEGSAGEAMDADGSEDDAAADADIEDEDGSHVAETDAEDTVPGVRSEEAAMAGDEIPAAAAAAAAAMGQEVRTNETPPVSQVVEQEEMTSDNGDMDSGRVAMAKRKVARRVRGRTDDGVGGGGVNKAVVRKRQSRVAHRIRQRSVRNVNSAMERGAHGQVERIEEEEERDPGGSEPPSDREGE